MMVEKSEVRRIAVALVDRCNYGRIKPLMHEINKHPDLELKVLCAGTMLLERFGKVVDLVRQDGFDVEEELYIEVEGANLITTAQTQGLAIIEFANAYNRLKPDMLLVIGDRFETLGAALAASYMNICIAHIQGGEVSYTNDEVARHALTRLAHYHFPATIRAGGILVMMGEQPETVFPIGCPVVDVINNIDPTLGRDVFEGKGLGNSIDPREDYFLVIFHPVPTMPGGLENDIKEILSALSGFGTQTLWLWPNIDAGSNLINKVLRRFHEYEESEWLYLMKNLSPEDFQKALANAKCAIGNSSSFVRDTSFWGTPTVLLGNRQHGREHGANVIECPEIREASIAEGIKKAVGHGRSQRSTLYGVGDVCRRIAQQLWEVPLYLQKQLFMRPLDEVDSLAGDHFNAYIAEREN